MNFCALIMAGGRGTRFWPKSTEEKPKQFLNLVGNKTMIQLTYERINKLIPQDKIFVVTCEKYKDLVKEQLPNIPEKNVIMEPEGRNTAPCILLATLYIKQIYGDCNIAVLPSDQIINDEKEFIDELKVASEYIENENKKAIVTIGIKPTRPETGYGYIKITNESLKKEKHEIIKVDKFVEKPNLEVAKEYVSSGKYLWNGGMFIFNCDYMLDELKDNVSQSYELLCSLPSIDDKSYNSELKKKYFQCESISIDYAVMEKSSNIYVIPSNFGWDDIGTWKSLERYLEKDDSNNISKGNVELSQANNCIAYSEEKRIIILGVQDLYVIEGQDTIVVCSKEKIDEVRNFRK